MTQFTAIYERFLGKITEDMYMELTPEDTVKDIRRLLIDAIPGFEFPRKNLQDYVVKQVVIPENETQENDFVIGVLWNDLPETPNIPNVLVEKSAFADDLTSEEINILAILMKIGWLQRQIASIENTRQKYSSSDFKFTSQQAHLGKLMNLLTEMNRESIHMQRLYKRRKIGEDGRYASNWGVLIENSALD